MAIHLPNERKNLDSLSLSQDSNSTTMQKLSCSTLYHVAFPYTRKAVTFSWTTFHGSFSVLFPIFVPVTVLDLYIPTFKWFGIILWLSYMETLPHLCLLSISLWKQCFRTLLEPYEVIFSFPGFNYLSQNWNIIFYLLQTQKAIDMLLLLIRK